MSQKLDPTQDAFLERFINEGKLTSQGAAYDALLTAIHDNPDIAQTIPDEKMEILSVLGTLKTGGSDEELAGLIDYAMRNELDPGSLTIDEGTMTPYGAGTFYTTKAKTHGGEDRKFVDYAEGIPTADKKRRSLEYLQSELENNPAFSDTTTTQEYNKLMTDLKGPGMIMQFVDYLKNFNK